MKHFKIFFLVEKMNFVRMLNTSRKCCNTITHFPFHSVSHIQFLQGSTKEPQSL